jgi:hypothetical protein
MRDLHGHIAPFNFAPLFNFTYSDREETPQRWYQQQEWPVPEHQISGAEQAEKAIETLEMPFLWCLLLH